MSGCSKQIIKSHVPCSFQVAYNLTWLFLISSFGRGMAWNLVPWGIAWIDCNSDSMPVWEVSEGLRWVSEMVLLQTAQNSIFSCHMSFLYNPILVRLRFHYIPQTSTCSWTRFHQWAVAGHRSADSRQHHGKGIGGVRCPQKQADVSKISK